jgi:hypothetical protein
LFLVLSFPSSLLSSQGVTAMGAPNKAVHQKGTLRRHNYDILPLFHLPISRAPRRSMERAREPSKPDPGRLSLGRVISDKTTSLRYLLYSGTSCLRCR